LQNSEPRKPGEAAFAVLIAASSLFLLYSAYGISGFEALSAPGAIPMAAAATMSVAAVIVTLKTLRKPTGGDGAFLRDVLPLNVIIVMAMLVAYSLFLKPLGFLPTSALFIVASIKLLSRRSWMFSLSTGLLSLLVIYLLFRIVFTVLMPTGIVPEGEILAWFRALFAKGS
jgi:hypothetical protein